MRGFMISATIVLVASVVLWATGMEAVRVIPGGVSLVVLLAGFWSGRSSARKRRALGDPP